MSAITTHVLDTSRGKPAAGIAVLLEFHVSGKEWKQLAHSKTDSDGRAKDLLPERARAEAGTYRLRLTPEITSARWASSRSIPKS
jgi:5-hydroxyisourate hydrolase